MQTCSSPTPAFAAYSLVCTALSERGQQGLVHYLVSDTTGPARFRFSYHLVAAKPRKTVPRQADQP